MKCVIFSAVFGMDATYPEIYLDNWDKVILTDNPDRVKAHPSWTVRLVKKTHETDRKSNRYYKWLSHRTFPEYDYIMYFDSKSKLKYNLNTVEHFMNMLCENNHLALFFEHPCRNCIYDELIEINRLRMDNPQNIDYIRNMIIDEGFPKKIGLTVNNIFIRQNNDVKLNEMLENMYDTIDKHICRDQVVFMFYLYKTQLLQNIYTVPYKEQVKLIHNPFRITKVD